MMTVIMSRKMKAETSSDSDSPGSGTGSKSTVSVLFDPLYLCFFFRTVIQKWKLRNSSA